MTEPASDGIVADHPSEPTVEVIEPRTEVAVVDGAEVDAIDEDAWDAGDQNWPHRFIEYRGDVLAVRKPTSQALAGFSLGVSRFVKAQTQNDITGMFIERHMSEASYDRMMTRLMDPDDHDYTSASVGEIMGLVVRLPPESDDDGDSQD